MPMFREMFHKQRYQRRFSGQSEGLQILPQSLVDSRVREIEHFHKRFQYLQIVPVTNVLSDHLLVQSRVFSQKYDHFLGIQLRL